MKTEIRCEYAKSVRRFLKTDFDYIGIGNDACIHKFLIINELTKLVNEISFSGKIPKVIIPFVPQRYLDWVIRILDDLLKECNTLVFVVNDYGILNYLVGNHRKDIKICVGKFLERSYSMVPWKTELLREEDEEIHKVFLRSTFTHSIKLDYFHSLGITDFETNATREIMDSFSDGKDNVCNVTVHFKFNSIAFTRACPIKRRMLLENADCIDCNHLCDDYCELNFVKKFQPVQSVAEKSVEDDYVNDESVKNLYPELYLKGNMIMSKSMVTMEELCQKKYSRISCVVFDTWSYEDDSLIIEDLNHFKNFLQKLRSNKEGYNEDNGSGKFARICISSD